MKQLERCRACAGRMVLWSPKTGDPYKCPLCNGAGMTEPLYDRLPYWYLINEASIAALGIRDGALTINPQADFEWHWLMATATGGIFSTRLTDAATSRAMQNAAVNNLNQWGTAQDPFLLVVPVILRARSALAYTLTDLSGNLNTIQLTLHGYDLYPLAGA